MHSPRHDCKGKDRGHIVPVSVPQVRARRIRIRLHPGPLRWSSMWESDESTSVLPCYVLVPPSLSAVGRRPSATPTEEEVPMSYNSPNMFVATTRTHRSYTFGPPGIAPTAPTAPTVSSSSPSPSPASGGDQEIGRALTIGSSNYDDAASIKTSNSAKAKYYGDITAATMGIRGFHSPERIALPATPQTGNGRVISRTGIDIGEVSMISFDNNTAHGRRNVSGAVLEEGRSAWDVRRRQVSGTT